ncbi:MAG: tRNA (adenosine(37)-N6)-threonylcarbamoyltransferase complex dimerization subunit type 1 TsaB [Ghiorsea sp.]|nr:tRNA (adenosine(37)-N6)-threonylcarbamoyltransferase complex dimerization subunit type 1 TsaB [Ghiorsea sp.]
MLALDTAVGASACLLLEDGRVHALSVDSPRAHSRELLPILQRLLHDAQITWQDLQGFAVGTGPGSFTGLRVACATIAGINASLKKPVYSLSSLAITARQAGDVDSSFWAIEDARSGLVYAAKFSEGQCVVPPQCLTWEAFLQLPPAQYIALSDITVDLPHWKALPLQQTREQALVVEVRKLQPDSNFKMWVEPLYLQPSQAEKNLK